MFTQEEKKRFGEILKDFSMMGTEFMSGEESAERIMWLAEQGYHFDLWDMEMASRFGRLDVVKFMVKKCRCTWTEWPAAAIYDGQPKIAAWLVKNGGPFHTSRVIIAAINKMPQAYFWLKQNLFAPLSPYLMIMAARMGNLQVIKDMLAEGYPFPIDLHDHARDTGHLDIVEWIADNYR